MKVVIKGEELLLSAEKAIFWPSKQALLITDLHLGKTNHLRKGGYPLTIHSQFATLEKLRRLIDQFDVKSILFLGDLFHSTLNNEWREFERFRQEFQNIHFTLIKGNHDIIDEKIYRKIGIETVEQVKMGPFLLSHEPIINTESYNLYGHIHPGIVLKGKGRMYNKLPCFYFGPKYGILPAFGTLTGLAKIKIEKSAKVFGVIYPEVVELS